VAHIQITSGGNTGIGKEIVRVLLQKNAKVYLASRNVDKGHAAIDELKKETGKEAQFLEIDLCSLKSIRNAAEEFGKKERELHALFNNG
jgi:retinol dehydrogenase-12